MKISLNTIRDMNQRYATTDTDITSAGTNAILEQIGAQLGAIEEVVDYGAKFQGVVVAKVVACEKHPNADRLNVCLIDDGGTVSNVARNEAGFVTVVCGAPNVREGLIVAWLPPGATVPDTVGKEPFVLGARELRGVISNGMIASPKELALGDGHDGIMEIEQDIAPGTDFAEAYGLTNDVVIDIENKMFTHRPDCFGFLGVARELAGIQGVTYKSPDWYISNPQFPKLETEALPLTINNELPELVKRFSAIVMSDITVGQSPVWLQVALAKVGSRSINNVVDLTNYSMQETGQPLHAYDYDKVKALSNDEATIVVRYPYADESVKLLNGKLVTPRPQAILIATDKQAIGIGGVMGGFDTEVDDNTRNIIIESASFDMYSIRRTSMAQGLFTDAVTRFNKGQSPLQTLAVLAKIVSDLQRYAGGKVASGLIEVNELSNDIMMRNSMHASVKVTSGFINARLGLDLSIEHMQTLLQNVEFVVAVENDLLTIAAPFWRTDIELREDVVEEVGRLYGFDKLPLQLPSRVIRPIAKDELMAFKTRIRKSLVSAGANEILSYTFVPGKLLENAGQHTEDAFKLSNALSPELEYYRLSLMPSLLEKVHPNLKAGYSQFALFELGKGHNLKHADDNDGLPTEFEMLDVVIAASDNSKTKGTGYFQAKLYLDTLADDFGLSLHYEPMSQASDFPVAQPYEPSRSAVVTDTLTGSPFGIIGEFTSAVGKAFKLPRYAAGFSISPVHLLNSAKQEQNSYRPLPRFPKITQDMTLKVVADLGAQKLTQFLSEAVTKAQPKNSASEINITDIFQKEDEQTHKQITVRLEIASFDRTLTDKEVNALLGVVANSAHDNFGADRI